MSAAIAIRRLPNGRIQARRLDGKPLTVEDFEEAKRLAAGQSEQPSIDQVIDETVTGVLIDSTVLGAPIWFAFSPAFEPGDGVPVFYADELKFLKNKPAETLRKIYETKRAFGLRTTLKQ